MTDVLIRGVPDDDLSIIDRRAARLGLSRGEYLRRRIVQDARRQQAEIDVDVLKRAADLAQDLLDDTVMREAWS
jgi:hypothetical protein